MLNAFASSAVALMERRGIISLEDHDIYVYGFELFLYTLFSTGSLLCIGFAFNRFPETVICLTMFYMSQTYGGGFHASTHARCFAVMLIGLFVYLQSFHVLHSPLICYLIFIISALYLWNRPLILHKNKLFLAYKSDMFIRRSRIVVFLQFVLFLFVSALGMRTWLHAISAAILLCSSSRFFGIYFQNKHSKSNNMREQVMVQHHTKE